MMASRWFYGNFVRLSSLCGWAFIGRTVRGDISLSWMIKQEANEHKKSKQSAKGATNAARDNFKQMWSFYNGQGLRPCSAQSRAPVMVEQEGGEHIYREADALCLSAATTKALRSFPCWPSWLTQGSFPMHFPWWIAWKIWGVNRGRTLATRMRGRREFCRRRRTCVTRVACREAT